MQRLLFTLLVGFIFSPAVEADQFCHFMVADCPATTPEGFACFRKICNGVADPDLFVMNKEQRQQFGSMSKGPKSLEEICKELTGVDPHAFGVENNDGEKERALAAKTQFDICLQHFGSFGRSPKRHP